METTKKVVIPTHFNLECGVRPVVGQDKVEHLEFSTSMHTLYWQTYGEHSRFFQAIKDGRLIGSRCPECQMILVPPMTWNCPDCDFVEMREVILPHHGVLAATAPITIFPPAHMHGKAPYCRGYVDVATDSIKASFISAWLETTTGLPRPGIFTKGVRMRLVFEDQREGRITDIFWVPWDEIPDELKDERIILASQLDFTAPKPPELKLSEEKMEAFRLACGELAELIKKVQASPRAQKDLGEHVLDIEFITGGGDCHLTVNQGELGLCFNCLPSTSDFCLQADDPEVLGIWAQGGSLTDAAVEGKLWLPNREAFAILPLLDRLPRSVRRDREEGKLRL